MNEHDDYAEMVDITFAQRPVEDFIARKILEAFCYDAPPRSVVSELGALLRQGGWELAPVFQTLFLSEAFYSDKAKAGFVKGPWSTRWASCAARACWRPSAACSTAGSRSWASAPRSRPRVNGWPRGRGLALRAGDGGPRQPGQLHPEPAHCSRPGWASRRPSCCRPRPAPPRQVVDALVSTLNVTVSAAEHAQYVDVPRPERGAGGADPFNARQPARTWTCASAGCSTSSPTPRRTRSAKGATTMCRNQSRNQASSTSPRHDATRRAALHARRARHRRARPLALRRMPFATRRAAAHHAGAVHQPDRRQRRRQHRHPASRCPSTTRAGPTSRSPQAGAQRSNSGPNATTALRAAPGARPDPRAVDRGLGSHRAARGLPRREPQPLHEHGHLLLRRARGRSARWASTPAAGSRATPTPTPPRPWARWRSAWDARSTSSAARPTRCC